MKCPQFHPLILSAVFFVSLATSGIPTELATSAAPKRIELFNGIDLTGWTVVTDPNKDASATWSVSDGMIHCSGKPRGFLRTHEVFGNYRLRLQWRFPEKAGNGGVFLHGTVDSKVWPECYEAQLQSGNAGELRVNGGALFQENSSADEKSRPRLADSSERPLGEWNDYEIVCQDSNITLFVNGVLQNKLENSTRKSGWIALQSEGGVIDIRAINLEPLD